ncbi:MAG TPA: hypothetical protein VFL41_09525 [Gaiellaceae bacterium]|nr:hypothetical protein [Gaiellaceae bacterium]
MVLPQPAHLLAEHELASGDLRLPVSGLGVRGGVVPARNGEGGESAEECAVSAIGIGL